VKWPAAHGYALFFRPPWAHRRAQHLIRIRTPATMKTSSASRRRVSSPWITWSSLSHTTFLQSPDTPQNSPYRIQKLPATSASSLRGRSTQSLNGATSRTRKLSNSSMASDVSFRLPTYEAPAVSIPIPHPNKII